jgi:hypothetical protein
LLQKLGKLPAGDAKSADEWKREFDLAKAAWAAEREQAHHKLLQLERQVQQNRDEIRQDIFQELRSQYEPRILQYENERKRLVEDLEAAGQQLAQERERFIARIEHLENVIPEAELAARTQAVAELQVDSEARLDEANRLRIRSERRAQDAAEESEIALRRATKEIARIQDELKEAREVAFRVQRDVRKT